jgi:hypothetical protein
MMDCEPQNPYVPTSTDFTEPLMRIRRSYFVMGLCCGNLLFYQLAIHEDFFGGFISKISVILFDTCCEVGIWLIPISIIISFARRILQRGRAVEYCGILSSIATSLIMFIQAPLEWRWLLSEKWEFIVNFVAD